MSNFLAAAKAFIILELLNLREVLVTFDQTCNVLLCILTGQTGYSDETMSAHCWRSYRDGKLWGRLFMPTIDWMFSWQAQTEVFLDELGNPIHGHCRRAYEKERARDYLPPEYRKPEVQLPVAR